MTLYSVILTIHICTALSLLASVLVADFMALRWIRGNTATLSAPFLHKLHYAIYIGLGIMLATGVYLFWPVQAYLLSTPAFIIKMTLVLTLLLNSIFISGHMHIATVRTFKEVSVKTKCFLILSGGVSFLAWVGTIAAATQLGL